MPVLALRTRSEAELELVLRGEDIAVVNSGSTSSAEWSLRSTCSCESGESVRRAGAGLAAVEMTAPELDGDKSTDARLAAGDMPGDYVQRVSTRGVVWVRLRYSGVHAPGIQVLVRHQAMARSAE